MKIKDHLVASLASKLQKAFGQDLADHWNCKLLIDGRPPMLYDEGDCRPAIVAIIKEWRKEVEDYHTKAITEKLSKLLLRDSEGRALTEDDIEVILEDL